MKRPTIADLAFTVYVYGALTGYYDRSLDDFRAKVGEVPNLELAADRRALLTWLNHWGCRHLAIAHHELAAAELGTWFDTHRSKLPDPGVSLGQLDDGALARLG